MKTKLSLIFLTFLGTWLHASENPSLLTQESNYVVIGAFAYQDNAVHFTELAKKNQFDARFEINASRNLFYVYVLQTEDRKKAFEQAIDLRKKSSFSDTWVFTGLLGKDSPHTSGTDVQPGTGEKIKQVIIEDKSTNQVSIHTTISPDETTTSMKEEAVSTKAEVQPTITATNNTTGSPTSLSTPEEEKDGRRFFFKIVRASNQKEVNGDIDLIDPEKQKKTYSYTGNKDVFVRPVNKSGNVLFKCEVFGYRKLEQAINVTEPQPSESVSVENGKVTVPFELVRLKKGDIAVMYNVFFYKDAAIMRPESRSEVTSLLEMMKENPKLKVRIHGHTNGGSSGKIIEVGDSKNYFSLTGTKEGYGSAKKLSEERAQIINDFLLSEGIDQSRMEIKAWGGKKPIFEKDHAQAQTNVRVEIEITED